MERKKQPKLVITFPTTTAAMAMEAACEAKHGRLIPIPREISAGCGLAWCAEPHLEGTLLQVMDKNNIEYQKKQVISLY
ncbi:hypothetical protein SRRS_46080 [Sporomusa rhizae]|uniref:DUF3343 domain-containing protein n=1 Tax=Sporomusa rhizae TaxID=357999 RepID=UPI00352B0370